MFYAKGAILASCSRRKSLSDKELLGAGGELRPPKARHPACRFQYGPFQIEDILILRRW
jgi:hypothetical protein